MNYSVLYIALFVSLSLIGCTYSKPVVHQETTSEDFRSQQWTFFLRQAQPWQGYWIRYDSAGRTIAESGNSRNFTRLSDSLVLQANSYENADFPTDGTQNKQWYYINGSPPQFGRRLLPDSSVSTEPLRGNLLFYPEASGIWEFANTNALFFGFENFIGHPERPEVRISLFHTYLSGRFFRIAFNREVADGNDYPSDAFSRDTRATVGSPNGRLPGVWTSVRKCISAGLQYTSRRSVESNILIPSGVEENNLLLDYPDGVKVSVPREIGSRTGGSSKEFHTQWTIRNNLVVWYFVGYGADGEMENSCTTTYTKQ